MRIRVNDIVIVIAGADKGLVGKFMKFLSNDRGLVEGVNLVKKSLRANPQKNEKGGFVNRESSIHLSNLAIYNPVTKKRDRIGYKILKDGKKSRYYKSNGELIDV